MSLDLPLVSMVMYLQDGEVNHGDEGRAVRFEKKMLDWRRDIVGGSKVVTRKEMFTDMCQVENGVKGYWCEGVRCLCARTHWVLQASESFCWDCMHDPCACSTMLVWDKTEEAYYRFFCLAMVKQRRMFGCRSRLGAWRQSITGEEKRRERKERTKREKKKIAPTTKKVH